MSRPLSSTRPAAMRAFLGSTRMIALASDDLPDPDSPMTPSACPGAPIASEIPSDARTLTSITCANETLTLVTDRETLTAAMPCERMLPEAITSRFIGKEVAIRYEDERLIVESAAEGTMEFPSERPAVSGAP